MDVSVETDENGQIRFENGRKVGNRWKVLVKLDEGGFGQVYKVEDTKNPGKIAALKVESVDMEGGSAIKLEINVLEHVCKKEQSPHLPLLFHARKHKRYVYMVMELLGRNLKSIKALYPEELMPAKDWARLGIQCLHSVKIMHDRGFVHRDIKPSNFVLGHHSDFSKARVVHILDFGLARAYAFRKGQRWEVRKARTHIDFRGTVRYASPNMHRAEELGRRDDIYSLMFMFIELHVGALPWQADKDKEATDVKKTHMEENPQDLVVNFPVEMHGVLPHLRTLNYYSRPNYNIVYEGLLNIMKNNKVSMNDKFDWETDEEYRNNISVERKCKCEETAALMSMDPIGINAPPATYSVLEEGPTKDDFKKIQAESAKNTTKRFVTRAGGTSAMGTVKDDVNEGTPKGSLRKTEKSSSSKGSGKTYKAKA